MRKQIGFTLMELLVVLMILGVLIGLVAPQYFGQVSRSQTQAAATQIDFLMKALEAFRLDMNRYPSQAEGLNVLVEKPVGESRWNGPYLKKGIPNDPWGRPYLLSVKEGLTEPIVSSLGRDGIAGGTGEDADVSSR